MPSFVWEDKPTSSEKACGSVYSPQYTNVEDSKPDSPQVEELEYMPTANRRRYMNEYMKDYRQGKRRKDGAGEHPHPDKRKKLEEAHRLDSFKWRLSKLLGPQYEILTCTQYRPEYGVFRDDHGLVFIYEDEFCSNEKQVLECFGGLREFEAACETRGGELFKVFLLRKYSRRFDWVTDCLIGVLDKRALFESLQRVSNQGGTRWEKIWNKVKIESREGEWWQLDFSRESVLWLKSNMICQPLKWTARDHPDWGSSKLYCILYGWAMGNRKVGSGDKIEWPAGEYHEPRRLIESAILWCDEYWLNEIA